jgi:hypothetical protein
MTRICGSRASGTASGCRSSQINIVAVVPRIIQIRHSEILEPVDYHLGGASCQIASKSAIGLDTDKKFLIKVRKCSLLAAPSPFSDYII